MSQQPSTVLNDGPPTRNNVPLNDVQASYERVNNQPQNGGGLPQQTQNYAPRPPLSRIDSRTTLPIRPGVPNQPGIRPQQQIRQPGQQQQQQFFQRPPGIGPRPPGQPQFNQQNQGPRFNPNTNFRQQIPFTRPPGAPRPPGIFQQRSVPSFGQQRPVFEGEHPLRSQTLDSADPVLINKPPENVRNSQEDISRVIINRSMSISSDLQNNPGDDRRRSITSIGSFEGRRSASGSIENLDKRSDNDYPSRPESRSSSRMNKIIEDDVVDKVELVKQTSSELPKPPVESIASEITHLKSQSISPSLLHQHEDHTSSNKINDVDLKNAENIQKEGKTIQKKVEIKTLDLKNVSHSKSPSRTEGDNDSGVDESTQGNDQSSNGDHSSPRKSSGKTTSRTSSVTPTKNRSLSRNSKSPSLKSPDSAASTPGATEKKKLPMNKIQVGSAPSPNLKVVRSKIGSLENASYKPGGGKVKIESKKLDFKNAAPRIEAKNDKYAPKGGEKKIVQQKLVWNAKSKIGSLENANHKPKGGDKKIETVKVDFKEKAKPKVGSKDNMKHVPGGGDVKSDPVDENIKGDIETKKLDIKVQSKVGSLDNVKHKPGGGDRKIFDDKDYLKQRSSALTSENHSLSGSQNSLPSQPEAGGPLADVNLNQER